MARYKFRAMSATAMTVSSAASVGEEVEVEGAEAAGVKAVGAESKNAAMSTGAKTDSKAEGVCGRVFVLVSPCCASFSRRSATDNSASIKVLSTSLTQSSQETARPSTSLAVPSSSMIQSSLRFALWPSHSCRKAVKALRDLRLPARCHVGTDGIALSSCLATECDPSGARDSCRNLDSEASIIAFDYPQS